MMALVRLPALMATAALGLGLTVVVWFPVSRQLIGSVFDGADYLLAYGLLMGLALWLSILAAASAYQFTRRVDLSLVLFTSFSALSLTVWPGTGSCAGSIPVCGPCPMTFLTFVSSGPWLICA